MRRPVRRFISLFIVIVALPAVGCVERTMTFTSDPPGTLVYLNGQEVGRTPLTRDFTWYGTYDLALRQKGYETIDTTLKVDVPTFQIIPLDLVTAVLPFWFYDHRQYNYNLSSAGNVPPPGLMSRAEEMRNELKGSQRPATQPAAR